MWNAKTVHQGQLDYYKHKLFNNYLRVLNISQLTHLLHWTYKIMFKCLRNLPADKQVAPQPLLQHFLSPLQSSSWPQETMQAPGTDVALGHSPSLATYCLNIYIKYKINGSSLKI